ncbi:Maltose-6'-phosphate glucosidase [Actinidia chinensis var. chinensis]|uniref:Maltose-6'-phosphate glucosidase n=1 Tax=Actinidia chinensis var. chinensis TaxID=1590841 RepID=A0A2R6QPC5_ACTCC|nr:Maltose-6'-phosphate glucosidase [Actinidia chinensis var. chinensis]
MTSYRSPFLATRPVCLRVLGHSFGFQETEKLKQICDSNLFAVLYLQTLLLRNRGDFLSVQWVRIGLLYRVAQIVLGTGYGLGLLELDLFSWWTSILWFEGSEVVERQNYHFSASMRYRITWDTSNSEPFLDVDIKLNLTLEVFTQPFTMLPISAVEGPVNLCCCVEA